MAENDVQLVIPALRGEIAGPLNDNAHASDHFRTPAVVLERVRQLGAIGLDPCATRGSLVDAEVEWYGPQHELENGLERSWAGRGLVYCFPPPRQVGEWAPKLAFEARLQVEIIALLSCRTDAAWLHNYVFPTAAAVCYWRGSLRVLGEPRKSVPPRAVVYWGQRAIEFRDAFAAVGSVVVGADVHRPRSWRVVVPRPWPVGTWLKQQGRGSRAVKTCLARFAAELNHAVLEAGCPEASGPRRAVITRHGARLTGPASLKVGGELVEKLLVETKLLSELWGYDIEWRQATDRRNRRTEIQLTTCGPGLDDIHRP